MIQKIAHTRILRDGGLVWIKDTPIVVGDSATALRLFDVSLKLEPYGALKEVQDPLGHSVKLMGLKPAREVALVFVVNFLETQGKSHEVDAYTGFAQIKELFTVPDKIIWYCQSV